MKYTIANLTSENIYIHCETKKMYNKVIKLLDKNDFKWAFTGEKLKESVHQWLYKKNECLVIYSDKMLCRTHYNDVFGIYKVITAQQFLEDNNENFI